MNRKMNGFNVEEDKVAADKRKNGSSLLRHYVHTQHRRSKSATDKNLETSKRGASHSLKKMEQTELHASPLSTRTYRAQSPLYDQPSTINKNASSNHRASLEKDTKELIAEIELLEEEVANREQHVLSLYRSIFEHCVSRPPSEQSSGVASPAHTKHVSKKHPSIISSAFCSSKKFPLRPLQALVSVNDYGKRASKTNNAPQFYGKSKIHFEKTCSDPVKEEEKVPAMEKTSMLRTLKDHLYQCPSKLSEEMVRCMAAVYCWLCGAASTNPGKHRSPLLSRSSTNVLLPRCGIGEECDWSCKSMVEISWISTDKSHFSRASYAINNYSSSRTTGKGDCKSDGKQYSNRILDQCVQCPCYACIFSIWNSTQLFEKVSLVPQVQAAYNIGGHIISANAIEQSIFCFRTPRIGRWIESILSTALRKKCGEERQLISSKFGLPNSEPLACFALCTGAFSDPVLKVYTASDVKDELDVAKREFLQANVVVKKSRKVFLPKVLERFAREACISSDDLLKWVTENVDKKLQELIQKCIDQKSNKKASQIIEWLPYSSRFRYVFSKDLMEKPWCGCEFLSSCISSGGISMSLAQAIKNC
ncbi:uncharacterized protein LOC116129638 isoform X3 [Pistacia vera]|uniref:uncharacterized protein LOC116129638 isoform X3 n=1 Tax=Pistacia vera TaxID=55513 RepID=UPI001262D0DA|nr:uncharacterized protein LOC116129638 isoform X3 [Pistacia vera]